MFWLHEGHDNSSFSFQLLDSEQWCSCSLCACSCNISQQKAA